MFLQKIIGNVSGLMVIFLWEILEGERKPLLESYSLLRIQKQFRRALGVMTNLCVCILFRVNKLSLSCSDRFFGKRLPPLLLISNIFLLCNNHVQYMSLQVKYYMNETLFNSSSIAIQTEGVVERSFCKQSDMMDVQMWDTCKAPLLFWLRFPFCRIRELDQGPLQLRL